MHSRQRKGHGNKGTHAMLDRSSLLFATDNYTYEHEEAQSQSFRLAYYYIIYIGMMVLNVRAKLDHCT